ncbi:MAG: hypothetical protein HC905_22705 [Bacteroidales bacterium]|nr:hypothetical protein [Bacteroidales bacterium]
MGFTQQVSLLTNISEKQVQSTLKLYSEGATIPFISRYRKEATGNLDEVAISNIIDAAKLVEELEKRKEAVIKSIEEQGKLTPELKKSIVEAATITEVEDIYLPYKARRKTRATKPRNLGLSRWQKLLWAKKT